MLVRIQSPRLNSLEQHTNPVVILRYDLCMCMDKQTLHKFVEEGLTIREIGERLLIAQTTVRYWLKKYALKTKRGPHGKLPKDYAVSRRCLKCGETDPNKFYGNKRQICAKCHNQVQLKTGRENRQFAVDYLGGKCEQCSFDKHPSAMDIHHVDPSSKDPGFSTMRYWNRDKIKAELDKCILLCKNCHAILHAEERECD